MEKVVPFFKSFTTIFYLKFSKFKNFLFRSIKVWKNLNLFEPVNFLNRIQTPLTVRASVLGDPPVNQLPPQLHGPYEPPPTSTGFGIVPHRQTNPRCLEPLPRLPAPVVPF
jgi:hypothetical protein